MFLNFTSQIWQTFVHLETVSQIWPGIDEPLFDQKVPLFKNSSIKILANLQYSWCSFSVLLRWANAIKMPDQHKY